MLTSSHPDSKRSTYRYGGIKRDALLKLKVDHLPNKLFPSSHGESRRLQLLGLGERQPGPGIVGALLVLKQWRGQGQSRRTAQPVRPAARTAGGHALSQRRRRGGRYPRALVSPAPPGANRSAITAWSFRPALINSSAIRDSPRVSGDDRGSVHQYASRHAIWYALRLGLRPVI